MSRRRRADNGQSELGLVEFRPIDAVRSAPENDVVYQPVSGEDPGIFDLARSIKEIGIQEPIVVSTDGFIISGHRRHMAAKIANLAHAQGEILIWRKLVISMI
jgi:hypothetical protein